VSARTPYPVDVTYAIVVAAGSGVRMGSKMPKALLPLGPRPLVAWSVLALAACKGIHGIVVAAPAGDETPMRMAIGEAGGEGMVVVSGGTTRQRSVKAALAEVPQDAQHILVHDAARPLLTSELIEALIAALDGAEGAIAASPVADTLKRAGEGAVIAETVDRAELWQAQTPQVFHADVLRLAFATATDEILDTATDCASMVESLGGRVRLVHAAMPNLKVTTRADLILAEQLLRAAGRLAD
jgi:2-C-methyl-D-erythritol 4-phosphate cytidylyltransferase